MFGKEGKYKFTRRFCYIVLVLVILFAGSFGNAGVSLAGYETYNGTAYPGTCLDIHNANASATDGQYTLLSNGKLINIYCSDMNTASPKEYLTLVNTGGSFNFATYAPGGAANGTGVLTNYTKIRINPATLIVTTNDFTFASYDETKYIRHDGDVTVNGLGGYIFQVPFGVARDCYSGYAQQGTGNIDLRGTPFTVASSQFFVSGYTAAGSTTYSSNNQVVNLTGGGYCGWNGPGGNALSGTLQLSLNSSSVAVINVSSSKANGSYRAGDVIPVHVTFNDTVNVTGTPQLTLNTGRTINYSSGTGTHTLLFNNTLEQGDTSANLNYSSEYALALNSGTITDTSGNMVDFTLPAVSSSSSLGGSKNLVVDTTAPSTPILSTAITEATNGNVTVTITYPTDAAQKKYQIGSGTVLDYTDPFVLTANDTVTAYAVDAVGNQSNNGTMTINNIDKVAPTATVSYDATGPTNQNVVATIHSSESVIVTNNSGLSTYTFTENGTFEFSFVDAAGNTGMLWRPSVISIRLRH